MWKRRARTQTPSLPDQFQKDLIVWKLSPVPTPAPKVDKVSEGLNSVETFFLPVLQRSIYSVSEGLNSVET